MTLRKNTRFYHLRFLVRIGALMYKKKFRRFKFKKKYTNYYLIVGIILICILVNYWEYIFAIGFIGLFAYYSIKGEIRRYKDEQYQQVNRNISLTDHMSGVEFEDYLCSIFRKKGYQVNTTPKSNDYGADLILKKNGETTVVQAKRYKDKVGVRAIQEVNAAIPYYKASKAIVITNSYFTPNAKSLAMANQIQLIDRDKLAKLIHELH